MMLLILQSSRIGAPILGILLPAVIFGISFLLTVYLIRHFIKQNKGN